MDETSADYPNYATALAVMAFAKARPQGWAPSVEPMVAQLGKQQFSEANGWKQADPPFGAWGMGGPLHRPPETGHVDLSMTRCVLEALRAAGVPASDQSIERALVYVLRSQNPDGGFYFSIPNPEINKAGENAGRFRSYGTATADGLLALRACGLPDSDSRVALAIQWLKRNHRPDRAPGFDHLPQELWSGGLRFYYAAAAARAVPGLPITLPKQEPDGSFRNSNPMVKEDDPLIATTFAAEVLTHSPT
jgi:squalene-hopene/tetraprenyl-beta-curcumene cyclase